jgi:hypothetical protein
MAFTHIKKVELGHLLRPGSGSDQKGPDFFLVISNCNIYLALGPTFYKYFILHKKKAQTTMRFTAKHAIKSEPSMNPMKYSKIF